MSGRYAVFFVPADDSELARFGFSVMGRDACNELHAPPSPDFNGRAAIVQEPRRYGFHATLKAPFELAAGRSRDSLLAAVQSFAEEESGVLLGGLAPALLGRFCALLLPGSTETAVNALAARCVTRFEPFRGPLKEADIARRRPETLTAQQYDYLQRFGYPHVFDTFRFHMTLSGPLAEPSSYLGWLGDCYRRQVRRIPRFDRVCVCHQADRQAPFVRIAEYRFKIDG